MSVAEFEREVCPASWVVRDCVNCILVERKGRKVEGFLQSIEKANGGLRRLLNWSLRAITFDGIVNCSSNFRLKHAVLLARRS